MKLAKLEEEKNVALRKSSKSNTYKGDCEWSRGTNIGNGPPQKTITPSTVITPVYPSKKLTQQEHRERREKVLCFNCEEKYTLRHKCKNNKLLKLEIFPEEEGEEELEDEEEIECSELKTIKQCLNSITGVSFTRLVGRINGKAMRFLVDIGATYNFKDHIIVEKLQLKGLKVDSFEVTVVRSEKMAGVHCCAGVNLIFKIRKVKQIF